MTTTPPAPEQASTRTFEVVLAHLERMVLEGGLRVGDRLPAERDLAVQLGVSRPAVREAIRTLEAQGVLASHVGSGASAGTHVINDRSQALGRLLRLQVALAQFPLQEVISTRMVLERTSAELACGLGGESVREELAPLLDAMDEALEPEAFNELDTAFHVAIARLGRNSLLGDLAEAVRESMRLPILAAEQQLDDWPGFRQGLVHEHRAIAEALEESDVERAGTLVEEHVRHTYAALPIVPLAEQPQD